MKLINIRDPTVFSDIIIIIIVIFITTSREFVSLLLLLFCLLLYFAYVYFLPFTRAYFVIDPWAVELARK
jgi:hypothetical protein